MKWFLFLLCCLATGQASAQSALVSAFDPSTLELAHHVLFPAFALFLLGYFVLAAVRLVLNYLLKRQIVAAAISESIVARLLPAPPDEQRKLVKWIALLLSSGGGLLLCSRYPSVGIHSLIIMLFSTAAGLLAYYLFLRRQAK